ncbi:Rpn family recombination-promoting nuclease/putative transposase [Clostridium sp. DJ247]|uniref:Rpn family recombination-promoting nuclease/putative transposase n=1 Tax=Clostridium sp. DJ247 TaxID=2726188 RepID=UPI001F4CC8ED|nr:Rpn family recombination-promoting nuclease/putative transposase [Clostridium sp. DJ247]
MQRLKPLNDFIFKKLFGENEVKDNLIAFLNAVLDRKDIDRLVTLEIIDNKELTREMINDKTSINFTLNFICGKMKQKIICLRI